MTFQKTSQLSRQESIVHLLAKVHLKSSAKFLFRDVASPAPLPKRSPTSSLRSCASFKDPEGHLQNFISADTSIASCPKINFRAAFYDMRQLFILHPPRGPRANFRRACTRHVQIPSGSAACKSEKIERGSCQPQRMENERLV